MTTAQEYQQFLVEEFNNALITANIERYWALSEGATDALTYLRTRLYIFDLALTRAAGMVSFKGLDGASVNQSDYFDHLLEARNLAAAELAVATGDANGVVAGTIAKTAPIMPPSCLWPDGNDRAYRGDVYRGRGRRRP